MSKNSKQLSCISLYGYKGFVSAAGGDYKALAKKADISAHALAAFDEFISHEQFENLLEITADSLDNPTFGLEYAFSSPESLPSLSSISFLLFLSKDLKQWVNFNSQYLNTHNYSIDVKLKTDIKSRTASLEITHRNATSDNWHLRDYRTALIFRLLRYRTNSQHTQPILVRLPQDAPASNERYEQLFNCPVEFGCPQCELVFKIEVLDVKLDAEQILLNNSVSEYLNYQTNGNAHRLSLSEKVSFIIPSILGTGRCNLYNIAKLFGMGTKTLQRQLEQENTSFSELLDVQRQNIAKKLLEKTNNSSTAIALQLDYSSLKAFSFAFKRWTGTTPNRYR